MITLGNLEEKVNIIRNKWKLKGRDGERFDLT